MELGELTSGLNRGTSELGNQELFSGLNQGIRESGANFRFELGN